VAETSDTRVARKIIELSETRKGTYVQVEAKLPPGFTPPSAALATPVEPVQASAPDSPHGNAQSSQQG
jgi:hypothetical protein